MIITVIGEGRTTPDISRLAEQVGRELASLDVQVACGGLGGVMEAVCKGAKSAGGTTIGILPGTDPTDCNSWVDIPICTGLGYARNIIVARAGRAVIAVGGAYGTLSEIGHALSDGIPVIGLNTWSISRKGIDDQSIVVAADPLDAVTKALQAANGRSPKDDHHGQGPQVR